MKNLMWVKHILLDTFIYTYDIYLYHMHVSLDSSVNAKWQ